MKYRIVSVIADPLEYYPRLVKLQNDHVPFSIAHTSPCAAEPNLTEELQPIRRYIRLYNVLISYLLIINWYLHILFANSWLNLISQIMKSEHVNILFCH